MEHVACKSLLFGNGCAFVFDADYQVLSIALEGATEQNVKVYITDYGLDLHIRNVVFPLQDNMLEHLAKQPSLVAYTGTAEDYLLSPAHEIKVPTELILEARGALNFQRSINKNTV